MNPWFKRNAIQKGKTWIKFCPQPISWQGWLVCMLYIGVVVVDFYFFPPWKRPVIPFETACCVAILFINAGLCTLVYFLTREKAQ